MSGRFFDEVSPKCSVGASCMRVFLGIVFHRFISCRDEWCLPAPTSPCIKVVFRIATTLQSICNCEAKFPRKCSSVTSVPKKHRITLAPIVLSHLSIAIHASSKVHPMLVFQKTCHDSGSGRHANSCCVIMSIKDDAVIGEAINIRCSDARCSVAA